MTMKISDHIRELNTLCSEDKERLPDGPWMHEPNRQVQRNFKPSFRPDYPFLDSGYHSQSERRLHTFADRHFSYGHDPMITATYSDYSFTGSSQTLKNPKTLRAFQNLLKVITPRKNSYAALVATMQEISFQSIAERIKIRRI